ncbi:MAG: ATP-binding protein [Gammaproteobacteria bacterium]
MQQTFINRSKYLEEIEFSFQTVPVCALIGPRQCGKTTIAKQYLEKYQHQNNRQIYHFDLEDYRDVTKLQDPMLFLGSLEGLIIIDEIHHLPDLFKSLRVLVDQKKTRNFLILGSASQKLLLQTSETLAGRIKYIEMAPFSLVEISNQQQLWSRGGFPLAYLANSDLISNDWRRSYIKTFLEKDIPNFGLNIAPQMIRRFWLMLAHYHAQIFNASEISNSLGIDYKTAQHYLDILESTFMIRRLNPWFANIKKRQIKSPKIYFRDSGLLHTLLGIVDYQNLIDHPKLGASWEGLAMEQIIRVHQADSEDCYFWCTQNNAELDLLIVKYEKKIGFEFKFTSNPKITKSMHIAINDLELDNLIIIIPEGEEFPLHEKIKACSLEKYLLSISNSE